MAAAGDGFPIGVSIMGHPAHADPARKLEGGAPLDLPEISPRAPLDLPEISPRSPLDLPEISPRSPLDLPAHADPARKLEGGLG